MPDEVKIHLTAEADTRGAEEMKRAIRDVNADAERLQDSMDADLAAKAAGGSGTRNPFQDRLARGTSAMATDVMAVKEAEEKITDEMREQAELEQRIASIESARLAVLELEEEANAAQVAGEEQMAATLQRELTIQTEYNRLLRSGLVSEEEAMRMAVIRVQAKEAETAAERQKAALSAADRQRQREALGLERERRREVERRLAQERASARSWGAQLGRMLPGGGGAMANALGGGPGAMAAGIGAAAFALQRFLGGMEKQLRETRLESEQFTRQFREQSQAWLNQSFENPSADHAVKMMAEGQKQVEALYDKARAIPGFWEQGFAGMAKEFALRATGQGELTDRMLEYQRNVDGAAAALAEMNAQLQVRAALEEQVRTSSPEQQRAAVVRLTAEHNSLNAILAGGGQLTEEQIQRYRNINAELASWRGALAAVAALEKECLDYETELADEAKRRADEEARTTAELGEQRQRESEQLNAILTRRAAIDQEADDEQALLALRLDGHDAEADKLEIAIGLRKQLAELGNAGDLTPELKAMLEKTAAMKQQLIDQEEQKQAAKEAADEAEREAAARKQAADEAERAKRALEDMKPNIGEEADMKGGRGKKARDKSRADFERQVNRGIREAGLGGEDANRERARLMGDFDDEMQLARGRFGGRGARAPEPADITGRGRFDKFGNPIADAPGGGGDGGLAKAAQATAQSAAQAAQSTQALGQVAPAVDRVAGALDNFTGAVLNRLSALEAKINSVPDKLGSAS